MKALGLSDIQKHRRFFRDFSDVPRELLQIWEVLLAFPKACLSVSVHAQLNVCNLVLMISTVLGVHSPRTLAGTPGSPSTRIGAQIQILCNAMTNNANPLTF